MPDVAPSAVGARFLAAMDAWFENERAAAREARRLHRQQRPVERSARVRAAPSRTNDLDP